MPDVLEIYSWDDEGYSPLVFSDGWQVALLNWEPLFDRANLTEIERHNDTDEVFVLLRGKAVLFVRADDGELQAVGDEIGQGVQRDTWRLAQSGCHSQCGVCHCGEPGHPSP